MTTAAIDRTTWLNHAACLGVDLTPIEGKGYRADGDDVFYDPATVEIAKRFCRENCTVIIECLNDALTPTPARQWGVRGALDADERKKLRRRRN